MGVLASTVYSKAGRNTAHELQEYSSSILVKIKTKLFFKRLIGLSEIKKLLD